MDRGTVEDYISELREQIATLTEELVEARAGAVPGTCETCCHWSGLLLRSGKSACAAHGWLSHRTYYCGSWKTTGVAAAEAEEGEADAARDTCPACKGRCSEVYVASGRENSGPCSTCHGTGKVERGG